MNTFQKNALFLSLLLFALLGVSAGGYFVYQSHKSAAEEQRLAWRKENIRQLEDLSRIGELSTEEQKRLDAAGDDVDRIQQVLLDLHTERHTAWQEHGRETKEKQRELQTVSYLAYTSEYREAQTKLVKYRTEIAENLSAYESGYHAIHDWRPLTFSEYQALTAKPGHAPVRRQNPELPAVEQKPPAGILSEEPTNSTTPHLVETVAPSGAPETEPSRAQTALDNVDVEVSQALRHWSSAMESNDPARVASCYAAQVDRYFLKLEVTNAQVESYMKDWYEHETKHIRSFSVRDVTFESETANVVKLRLVKSMTIADDQGTTAHLIRSRLYLTREAGEWKISSEQDFKD